MATSRFGKKGSAVKISDAKRDLKARFGLSQPQVMSNLTYLIDRNWVKTVEIEKTVSLPSGTVPSTVTWYEISALGIDKIEGESEFQPKERYEGINITAMGSNVITLGDGNVVNAEYRDLHAELNDLKRAIVSSQSLSDLQKLEVSADIESVKDQLAKARPDKTIVARLWAGIQNIVIASEFIELVHKVGVLIHPLIS